LGIASPRDAQTAFRRCAKPGIASALPARETIMVSLPDLRYHNVFGFVIPVATTDRESLCNIITQFSVLVNAIFEISEKIFDLRSNV
jgi:hypothetical protein